MATSIQIDNLERKLNQLSERCKEQENTARGLIEYDQSEILIYLRDGVQSVQAIIRDLGKAQDLTIGPEDHLSLSLDYISIEEPKIPGAFIVEVEVKTGVVSHAETSLKIVERCTEISSSFTKLAISADKQLEDIMSIQLKVTDFDAELDRLQDELVATTRRARNDTTQTQESLKAKKTEREGRQSRLSAITIDLRDVEEKMSDNKTQRKVAKVVKYGALAISPVFLPAIGIAAGMQVGQLVLKDKKQDLINTRDSVDSQQRTLKIEIASLEKQNKDLEADLKTQSKLSARCSQLNQRAKSSKRDLASKANDSQALKEAASRFLLWTEILQSRAGLMEDFDDGEQLRQMALRLVDDLSKNKRQEVIEICQPLQALILGWETGSDE